MKEKMQRMEIKNKRNDVKDGCLEGVRELFTLCINNHTLFVCVYCRTVEHCFHMCDRVVIYFFIAASYTPW